MTAGRQREAKKKKRQKGENRKQAGEERQNAQSQEAGSLHSLISTVQLVCCMVWTNSVAVSVRPGIAH